MTAAKSTQQPDFHTFASTSIHHLVVWRNACVCMCARACARLFYLASLRRSCGQAKAVVILQPAAKAVEHRYFIMASFITSGTVWQHSQSQSPPPHHPPPQPCSSLLSADAQVLRSSLTPLSPHLLAPPWLFHLLPFV